IEQREVNWGYMISKTKCYAEAFVVCKVRHMI
ncbi:unnamed protein product, partial [marine sediment metagenome]